MFWVIITVLVALVVGGCILTMLAASTNDTKLGAGLVLVLTVVVWGVVSIFMSVHTVGERQVGIVYDFSGTIAGQTESGVVWTAPWQHIKREDISLQNELFELNSENAAVTKDQQAVTARLAVNLVVEPDKVQELYSEVGPGWKAALLEARVLQDFKEITASFTTPELTEKRAELRVRTKERLADELDDYSIRVVDVFIKNLGFSAAYSKAIEQKVVQQQATLREQNKKQEVQAIADQAVIRAEGEAKANRLRRTTLTPLLVQQQAIEALGDDVSVICTGECPFLPQSLFDKQP